MESNENIGMNLASPSWEDCTSGYANAIDSNLADNCAETQGVSEIAPRGWHALTLNEYKSIVDNSAIQDKQHRKSELYLCYRRCISKYFKETLYAQDYDKLLYFETLNYLYRENNIEPKREVMVSYLSQALSLADAAFKDYGCVDTEYNTDYLFKSRQRRKPKDINLCEIPFVQYKEYLFQKTAFSLYPFFNKYTLYDGISEILYHEEYDSVKTALSILIPEECPTHLSFEELTSIMATSNLPLDIISLEPIHIPKKFANEILSCTNTSELIIYIQAQSPNSNVIPLLAKLPPDTPFESNSFIEKDGKLNFYYYQSILDALEELKNYLKDATGLDIQSITKLYQVKSTGELLLPVGSVENAESHISMFMGDQAVERALERATKGKVLCLNTKKENVYVMLDDITEYIKES